MFERIIHSSGVVYYRSSLLHAAGVPHAFATRKGGVSQGPFASLNLGNPSLPPPPPPSENGKEQPSEPVKPFPQDPQANIDQNYQRLLKACGMSTYQRAWVKQIHSSRVESVELVTPGPAIAQLLAEQFSGQHEADALITNLPGVALSIRVADCVPVLLASSDGQWVAAVHAGWRGVVNNIVGRAIRSFGEEGIMPEEIIAAIGPCIGKKHFEVGLEVASFFDLAHLSRAVDRTISTNPHVDLTLGIKVQLQDAGVTQIDAAAPELCTFAGSEEFFSHRRERGITGRQAALIGKRVV